MLEGIFDCVLVFFDIDIDIDVDTVSCLIFKGYVRNRGGSTYVIQ